ncbi:MAG: FeoB-associated Cys-rich membrane protein [Clostridia bacterium]|nr:FeoB-associated Cys-rich membrane protein [Clostridia bacterium]
MDNIIAVAVILAIVGIAVWYVIRAKKSGKKCIGCPDGCCSSKKDGSPCSCCSQTNDR